MTLEMLIIPTHTYEYIFCDVKLTINVLNTVWSDRQATSW